ncbi:MAG: isoprenyl transferase [Lentisphaeria bacterium]|nr:isoprenyl transferase [Lentisphaeria bacterium]
MTDSEKNIPRHVAMIMDGNGRWARRRGLSANKGHRAGAETVKRMVEACSDYGIRYLTLYAFSTENWSRSKREVSGLMTLLKRFLAERVKDLQKNDIRLNAIGDLAGLPADVRSALQKAMNDTAGNSQGVLTLALNYGARQEIAATVRDLAAKVLDGEITPADITPGLISSHLSTADLPDPDLIIRTSGELRLSNFLLWQASYSEFWFTDTLWPDFSKEDFAEALAEYARRKRRFGGRKD